MSSESSIRVDRATREHLNAIRAKSGETADATIRRALALLDLEEWRRTAELDAYAASLDLEDQAEVRAAMSDLAGCVSRGASAFSH